MKEKLKQLGSLKLTQELTKNEQKKILGGNSGGHKCANSPMNCTTSPITQGYCLAVWPQSGGVIVSCWSTQVINQTKQNSLKRFKAVLLSAKLIPCSFSSPTSLLFKRDDMLIYLSHIQNAKPARRQNRICKRSETINLQILDHLQIRLNDIWDFIFWDRAPSDLFVPHS